MKPGILPSEYHRMRDEVLESIREGRLVPVAGTGVSLASLDENDPMRNVAGWKGLLQHGLERCLRTGRIDKSRVNIEQALIENGNVEELVDVAQKIMQRFTGVNEKMHWLRDTVGAIKVHESRKGVIQAIGKLGKIIATLNYDDLITQVTGLPPYHWGQNAEVVRLLRRPASNFVFHLHGHFQDPSHVVLDRSSYNEIQRDKKAQTVQRVLMYTKTLLFIGCKGTFEDPNFQVWLDWAKSVMQGLEHRHYILCTTEEEEDFLKMLGDHSYIAPLVYGEIRDDLKDFLEKLASDATATTRTAAVPAPQLATGSSSPARVRKPSDIRQL